ncbi:MAG: hypothetical protein QNJ74_18210 [Trichodesmium sp. MO_231.B1]|nr:hypothetical protein [Trichodesmium sp. MO_231.B1]
MLRIVRGIKIFFRRFPFDKAVRPRALRVRQLLQVGEPAQRTALTVSRRKRSEPGVLFRNM